jgi:heptaprenyl diphosphate synthase
LLSCLPKKEILIHYNIDRMNDNSELLQTIKDLIEKNGQEAADKAKAEILNSKYDNGPVSSALKYFAKVNLKSGLPVFPALLTLSCKAMGKNSEKTVPVGASLALIAWAADIHDDIIDESLIKYSKKTVYGKFGSSIALLAGDALLIQGSNLLHKECEALTEQQKTKIIELVSEALFEISKAEAKEVKLRNKPDLTPKEVFELIELKAVVPALHCKVGAIIGQGTDQAIESLGNYGRIYGIVALMLEEFMDLMDYDELKNRIEHEYLPLPILCAFESEELKSRINALIETDSFNERNHGKLIELIMETKQTQELNKKMQNYTEKGVKEIGPITGNLATAELTTLLQVISESLSDFS